MNRDEVMALWVREYGKHPHVRWWLENNLPPKDWRGTPEQWAFTEMPFAPAWILR